MADAVRFDPFESAAPQSAGDLKGFGRLQRIRWDQRHSHTHIDRCDDATNIVAREHGGGITNPDTRSKGAWPRKQQIRDAP